LIFDEYERSFLEEFRKLLQKNKVNLPAK